ncbi:MAG: S8 family serine peptidase [Candidatus Zixiibacteriota bacterium]
MAYLKKPIAALRVFIIIGLISSPVTGHPFEECGTLVEREGCLVFTTGGYNSSYYILDNYDQFEAGQEVCVSGDLDPYYHHPHCRYVDGIVRNNSIGPGSTGPGFPFEACGVLVERDGCLLFDDGISWHKLLELEDIGSHQAGDMVCVSGILDFDCESTCGDAGGCLNNNIIEGSVNPNPPMRPGQVVFKAKRGFRIEKAIEAFDGVPEDTIKSTCTYLVSFPDRFLVSSVIEYLEQYVEVEQVQPNYMMELPEIFQISQSFPDQGQPSFLEGEEPISYYEQSGISLTKRDPANVLSTGKGIVVAVIDNGVDTTHPLFEGYLVKDLYDFVDNDVYPVETEGKLYGHGTFVAGLIRLMAPEAIIMPLRVFDGNGFGYAFSVSEAIYWAIDNKADIINMSFGFASNNPVIETAVNDALAAGIILVAAVGNDSSEIIKYPAAYDSVIAVSSLDTLGNIADFANFGPGVDICAPGVSVYSSLAGEYRWGRWTGTSFSAPLVSGACALTLGKKYGLTPGQANAHIRKAANKNINLHRTSGGEIDVTLGIGTLDAFEAVVAWCRGDFDNSDKRDIADITALIRYLYGRGKPPEAGETLADCDCNGIIDITDISLLIKFLFITGVEYLPCYIY